MTESDKTGRNIAASVRARLLNKARAERLDFNLLITRYALERVLYRLSISEQGGQFLLKGALLFDIWFDVPHRPTHDADLLGFGSTEIPHLENLFREVSQIAVEDGIAFQADTVRAADIRKEANYAGVRVTMTGLLAGARCPVQIDIGFGDAVTPAPENVQYPVILDDMPQPQLRVYPRYTVVAEKLEAMVKLGILNSRMKDYFDLWVLSRHSDFDGAVLAQAIRATFERRGTDIPTGLPFALTDEFALHEQKIRQWTGFQRKNALEPMTLAVVIEALREFLLPVLTAGDGLDRQWRAGAGWGAA
ncbi:nucleotidyl transferase AbiEii/AbiGii toxin family protein [Pseudomonas aeruginosa]|uniref:nucleotidyl transferase AbiEii/AbiGii toxin family protein n=1 Tax=Pseudomonas aeruginosa TaxID=287 RepID=UPI00283AA1B8|nr:nucleotidyl transferase AbiEii/AbiGii toxin family protein [Pseudomonas aeruginosa]MBX6756486.1 nucleotidyl transferase AbiEii/AbiGii toxin family protein [Pseudomonas aeruginosa]WMU68776.1 nucleotidyl transferase AbiEii/AbiGii toxin family protein [Pseudomonas aeruginosa]HBO7167252.1 nucleotidyl transferase AbiEii/AbiGii toxin family protein [Pseudomonas aeruginosa]HBO7211023.1 nucleotidyl transferase AbiEii/AbiGii toxin family protein [Pseudomonas aeruginosa]HBO7223696.1 nucleotidyl trans